MTIDTDTTPVEQYTGNGSTTDFTFGYDVLEDNDVLVTLLDDNGDAVSSTLDGAGTYDYAISGTYDSDEQRYPNGVDVQFNTAPPSGYEITLSYTIDRTQGTDYVDNDDFPANTHERALDKLTLICQEIDEVLTRTFKFAVSYTGAASTVIPTPLADAVLKWNSSSSALENGPTTTEIENAETNATAAAASAATATAQATVATTQASAASASAALAQAAALGFRAVVPLTGTIAPDIEDDSRTYYVADASSIAAALTLPLIGSNEGAFFVVQGANDTNGITINRSGTDTINGGTSLTVLTGQVYWLIADDNTPDNWITVQINTLDIAAARTWTGPQGGAFTDVSDGTIDMTAGNNFNWTPVAADVLEFSNETEGQGGIIHLDNSSGYTITKGSEVMVDANLLATISEAGVYALAYYSPNGTNVVVTNSLPVSA